MTYRAAIWTSDDHQHQVVLTGPEHSSLSDDELEAEGRRWAEESGTDVSIGTVDLDDWTE